MLPQQFGAKNIIPQNSEKVQAELSTNRQFPYNLIQTPEDAPLLEQVQHLYDLGFNVFPQPLGKKAGLPWQKLQYTRLHRDHAKYGLPALFNMRCNVAIMCGKTSSGLFVIDCETLEAFQNHLSQLRQRDIPIWAVRTARGGHIYLRCKEGEVANVDTGAVPNTEIKGCRRYVLAPPSIHPNGDVYAWIAQEGNNPPQVSITAIDWLTDTKGLSISLKLDQPKKPRLHYTSSPAPATRHPLSKATRDYLINGHTLPEGCRNNRLFNATCDLAGNGYNYDNAYNQLAPIAQASGLSKQEITRTIQSAFSQNRTPAKPKQSQDQHKHNDWKQALNFYHTHNWESRCGYTDKAVFLALAERAKHYTSEHGVFRASIREISEIARVTPKTTQKALKRLENSTPPLIFQAGSDKISGASLWRFSNHILTTDESKSNTLESPPHWLSSSVVLSNSDVLERGALGQVGWTLYQAMLLWGAPLMPKVVAGYSGLKLHQVNYYLPKLRDFGLVERVDGGWVAVMVSADVLSHEVPVKARTYGKGEARRRRFSEERALDAGRRIMVARRVMERPHKGTSYSQEDTSIVTSDVSVLESAQEEVETDRTCTLPEGLVQQQPECMGIDSSIHLQPASRSSLYEVESARTTVQLWECPNCGQLLFSDSPPDMCDFCGDFTTWKPRSGEIPPDTADEIDLDDPLLRLAFELGGVLRAD